MKGRGATSQRNGKEGLNATTYKAIIILSQIMKKLGSSLR
jgi:hypothetical protein